VKSVLNSEIDPAEFKEIEEQRQELALEPSITRDSTSAIGDTTIDTEWI